MEKYQTLEQAHQRIQELEKALAEASFCLKEWNDVSRKLLLYHQHNTATLNRQVLNNIDEVLKDG